MQNSTVPSAMLKQLHGIANKHDMSDFTALRTAMMQGSTAIDADVLAAFAANGQQVIDIATLDHIESRLTDYVQQADDSMDKQAMQQPANRFNMTNNMNKCITNPNMPAIVTTYVNNIDDFSNFGSLHELVKVCNLSSSLDTEKLDELLQVIHTAHQEESTADLTAGATKLLAYLQEAAQSEAVDADQADTRKAAQQLVATLQAASTNIVQTLQQLRANITQFISQKQQEHNTALSNTNAVTAEATDSVATSNSVATESNNYSGTISINKQQTQSMSLMQGLSYGYYGGNLNFMTTIMLSFLALSILYGKIMLTTTKLMNKYTKLASTLNQDMNALIDLSSIVPYTYIDNNGNTVEVDDLYEICSIALNPSDENYNADLAVSVMPLMQLIDPDTGASYFADIAFNGTASDMIAFDEDAAHLTNDINSDLATLGIPPIDPFQLNTSTIPTVSNASLNTSLQGIQSGLTVVTNISTDLQVAMQAMQLAYTQAIKMACTAIATMKDAAQKIYNI